MNDYKMNNDIALVDCEFGTIGKSSCINHIGGFVKFKNVGCDNLTYGSAYFNAMYEQIQKYTEVDDEFIADYLHQ